MTALDQAIDELGGVTALAKAIGASQSTVSNWRIRGRVPAEHWLPIEKATSGSVTCHDLWADAFGEKASAA